MQDILDAISARRADYLDRLIRLCRQPSIAAQGVGMAETASLVEQMLRAIGANTQQVPTGGYPVVYGEIGKGDRTLLFYNHYDVQPPEPLDEWTSDPFAAEVRDGALYARGVADNKGNIAARIAAVDAYLAARGKLPCRVKFIIEGEEEIGSPSLPTFADANRELVQADACVWEAGYADLEGRREIYLGVKGILYVELEARKAVTDWHSAWATIVPNAAWYLLRVLGTLRDVDGRVLIPGFYDRVRPPTEADREALGRMAFDEHGRLAQLGIRRFNRGLTGMALLEEHLFQPTCNIAGLSSGYTGPGMKTVLPHRATAKIDFRLAPDQDPHEIFDLLMRHLQEQGFGDIGVRLLSAEHPARTPVDHPFARLVEQVTREVSGKEPVVYPLTPATGPMHALCARYGIPTASTGVGHSNSHNHAPDENILLDDFYMGIGQIAGIIERFGA